MLQHQNNITEFLVKQQTTYQHFTTTEYPHFKGNPLDYRLFIRAFEHKVESKTDNNDDRLYFLKQHISGQPRQLIRSCTQMDPELGYQTAKKLIKGHFGNDYSVAVGYINKALNWSKIQSDDGEAVNTFALFLASCNNAVAEMELLGEMNSIPNMRALYITSMLTCNKLCYKWKESWWDIAYDIQEKQARRLKFKDCVTYYITTQAKVALHPLFGELKDGTRAPGKSAPHPVTGKSKSTFSTVATPNTQSIDHTEVKGNSKEPNTNHKDAFAKPSLLI